MLYQAITLFKYFIIGAGFFAVIMGFLFGAVYSPPWIVLTVLAIPFFTAVGWVLNYWWYND